MASARRTVVWWPLTGKLQDRALPTLRVLFELLHAVSTASSLLTSHHLAIVQALPSGSRIASFEIEAVIARGPTSFVYLAQDLTRGLPVAIKEYAPARRMGAAPFEAMCALTQRGLQAFMAEARLLAACHHPALVRVEALIDANGTAYRVMPFYKGLSLVHVCTALGRSPDDATLRAWGSDLLAALQALHATGHAHGGVNPENILLLADDRPLLLGAGSASHRVGSDLVESLLADFGLRGTAATPDEPNPALIAVAASGAEPNAEPQPDAAPAEAVADDLSALAAVLRFCSSGEPIDHPQPPELSAPYPAGRPVVNAPPQSNPVPPQQVPAAASNQVPLLAPLEASAHVPLPSPLFAEHVHLGEAGNHHLDGAREEALPLIRRDHATSEMPVPMASALTQRPFIPQRWRIPVWVGLIALSGVAVLAVMGYVMGAWNRMPPIDFDRSVQTAPQPSTSSASASSPASESEPAPESAPASASELSESTAAPAQTNLRDAPVAPVAAPPGAAAPVALAALAKSTAKNANERAPQKGVKGAAQKPVRKRPTRTLRTAQPGAAVKVASPLAACGARTNFALERCMQTQCRSKRWASHPQCTSRAAA